MMTLKKRKGWLRVRFQNMTVPTLTCSFKKKKKDSLKKFFEEEEGREERLAV